MRNTEDTNGTRIKRIETNLTNVKEVEIGFAVIGEDNPLNVNFGATHIN